MIVYEKSFTYALRTSLMKVNTSRDSLNWSSNIGNVGNSGVDVKTINYCRLVHQVDTMAGAYLYTRMMRRQAQSSLHGWNANFHRL